jgi:hypothetical protein
VAEPPRVTLRRQVATAAGAAASEQEFFARLSRSGVLVRTRSSTRDPGQLTGYAVALPGDTTRGGSPVWYGGGKLAPDLTLPKLRRRLGTADGPADGPFTAAERGAVWEHVARVAGDATAQIRALAAGDPARTADTAWAAADALHVAAAALGSRILRQAADAYDRAARTPYGRVPAPTPAGNSLRRAARLLAAYGYITSGPSFGPILLITRLAALAEAVATLRQAQERAVQAASALSAAEQLHAAERSYTGPAAGVRHPARAATALADAAFPAAPSPITGGAPASAPAAPGAGPPATSPKPRRH